MAWLHCILSTQICCDLLELPLAHSYLNRLRPDKNKAGFGLTSSGIIWGDDFGCFFWGAFLGRSSLLPDVMNTIFHYISHISIGKWHYLDSFSWRRKCFLLFSESGRYLCFTSNPRDLDDLGSQWNPLCTWHTHSEGMAYSPTANPLEAIHLDDRRCPLRDDPL